MRATISTLLGRGADEAVTVAECRRCGTTVESASSTCSGCGGDDIVTYTIR